MTHAIEARHVHEILSKYQLVDGYPLVLDLDRSHGIWLYDCREDEEYLDAFTCFASWPLGFNHPMLRDEAFLDDIMRAALVKVSNADIYTREMASFVSAFGECVTPPGFPYHFWIAGGALAVENAVKTAFDWKARKIGRTTFDQDVNDLVILHFRGAFHGRSGYTLSLTNTVPDKVGLFPKFDWPRVHSPAIEFDLDGGIANDIEAVEAQSRSEIEAAFAAHAGHVAAIIIEPLQGEGGDNHFRKEFFTALRDYADREEALLIFDEVQTGFFGSGKPWLWQHYGVAPDIVAFGKKSQVCGIYASERIDEVKDHVFERSSRINSTWGGNLVDMVRSRRFIEIIETDELADNIAARGEQLVKGLRSIAKDSGAFDNVRGIGSMIAFTFEDAATRNAMLLALFERKVLALSSGDKSIRFRLPLIINEPEADELLERVSQTVGAMA
jgi:L-lysine 6-transaminase